MTEKATLAEEGMNSTAFDDLHRPTDIGTPANPSVKLA
jgi:hypothetical protein